MCVVLIGRQQEGHPTQRQTPQRYPRLNASMIMLPDGEKKALTMCVVLISRQEEGPCRRKHKQYLDVPEQLQSWLCKNTHCTQRCTHQRSSRLHASMIMLRDGEKEESTMCVVLIVRQQEGPWRWKHARYLDGLEQLQSRLCENTHLTQLCTHQRFPRLHA